MPALCECRPQSCRNHGHKECLLDAPLIAVNKAMLVSTLHLHPLHDLTSHRISTPVQPGSFRSNSPRTSSNPNPSKPHSCFGLTQPLTITDLSGLGEEGQDIGLPVIASEARSTVHRGMGGLGGAARRSTERSALCIGSLLKQGPSRTLGDQYARRHKDLVGPVLLSL